MAVSLSACSSWRCILPLRKSHCAPLIRWPLAFNRIWVSRRLMCRTSRCTPASEARGHWERCRGKKWQTEQSRGVQVHLSAPFSITYGHPLIGCRASIRLTTGCRSKVTRSRSRLSRASEKETGTRTTMTTTGKSRDALAARGYRQAFQVVKANSPRSSPASTPAAWSALRTGTGTGSCFSRASRQA
jgi:hypothetical protein